MQKRNRFKISVDRFTTWDISFSIWFLAEYCFYHSIIDTSAVILFIAISALFTLKRGFHVNAIMLWIGGFAFVSWLNIRLGYSLNANNSYEMLTSIIKNVPFLMMLSIYVKTIGIERFKNNFITSSILSSILIIILSIITKGTIVVRLANGTFFNPNYLAVCNSIATIVVLGKEDISVRKKVSIILFLIVFCVLAGTRKALLAIIIGTSVYFCAKYPQKLLKNFIIFIVVSYTAYLLVTKIPYLYNTVGYRFVAILDYLNGGTGDSSIYMRSWYIETGISKFRESPIWGHGLNCFRLIQGARGTYSHNNYVELLFSLGLIGTVVYYSIHAASLIYGVAKYKTIDRTNVGIAFATLAIVLFTDYAMVGYYERGSLIYIVLFYMLMTVKPYGASARSKQE